MYFSVVGGRVDSYLFIIECELSETEVVTIQLYGVTGLF